MCHNLFINFAKDKTICTKSGHHSNDNNNHESTIHNGKGSKNPSLSLGFELHNSSSYFLLQQNFSTHSSELLINTKFKSNICHCTINFPIQSENIFIISPIIYRLSSIDKYIEAKPFAQEVSISKMKMETQEQNKNVSSLQKLPCSANSILAKIFPICH
jgi:hypothetical protein